MLARLRLIPHDERFFDLFNRSAENNLEGARLLLQILNDPAQIDRHARHLKDIEHRGDEITHQVFRALHRTFVTPLDREDISHLAATLDDVIDWIEEVGRRMRLYRITETPPLAKRFGQVILEQCEQLAVAVPLLEDRKRGRDLERATQEIHRLENEADDMLAEGIAGVYEGITEVPALIRAMRLNDLYQLLEDTTDKVEQAAVAVQNIAMKNA